MVINNNIYLSNLDFEKLKNIDLTTIDRKSLVELSNVKVDSLLTREAKILDFVKQIKNPYCFKSGKFVVKVTFANTNETLDDKLMQFFSSL